MQFLPILLLATALPAHAASLCTAREQVVFSCPVSHRIVSLCASRGISPTRGHLRYAFGRPGHVETQISTGDAAASFSEGVIGYPRGGADYVRIRSGRTAYVVYAAMVPGWEQDGVVVERDGKRVKSLLCPGYALGPDGWAPAYAARLAKDTQGFEVPDAR